MRFKQGTVVMIFEKIGSWDFRNAESDLGLDENTKKLRSVLQGSVLLNIYNKRKLLSCRFSLLNKVFEPYFLRTYKPS